MWIVLARLAFGGARNEKRPPTEAVLLPELSKDVVAVRDMLGLQ